MSSMPLSPLTGNRCCGAEEGKKAPWQVGEEGGEEPARAKDLYITV